LTPEVNEAQMTAESSSSSKHIMAPGTQWPALAQQLLTWKRKREGETSRPAGDCATPATKFPVGECYGA